MDAQERLDLVAEMSCLSSKFNSDGFATQEEKNRLLTILVALVTSLVQG